MTQRTYILTKPYLSVPIGTEFIIKRTENGKEFLAITTDSKLTFAIWTLDQLLTHTN